MPEFLATALQLEWLMSNTAIAFRGVQKNYNGVTVLKDITFSLEPGQFCALVGKNGVGKSTLMRLVMRLETPNAGEGRVLEFSLEDDDPTFHQEIGYVSETFQLGIIGTLWDFVSRYEKLFDRFDLPLFELVCERFSLDLKSNYRALSRGQKMQFAFALAVARHPRLLVVDEVTSVLDPDARAFVMTYLNGLVQNGGTVLFATNVITEVQHYATKLLLLQDGVIKLELDIQKIQEGFQKIRRPSQYNHMIYARKECVEINSSSDGSPNYIVPTHLIGELGFPRDLIDRRGLTPEDIFIYFSRGGHK